MAANRTSDSSAARNNSQPRLPNDVANSELIARVFATADGAVKTDVLLDSLKGHHIALQVKNAFALSDSSPATWQTFIDHEYWTAHPKQKPDINDQQSAPRFVFRIYFSENESGAKRANEIWTAVKQLLHENLTHAQIIAEFQKGLGKKGMNLRAVCRRAADRNRPSDPTEAKAAKAATARAAQGKPGSHARTTKKTAAVRDDCAPTKQHSTIFLEPLAKLAGMDSMRLYFPDGVGEFARVQEGTVLILTVKNLGIAKGGYEVELIKMKPKKLK